MSDVLWSQPEIVELRLDDDGVKRWWGSTRDGWELFGKAGLELSLSAEHFNVGTEITLNEPMEGNLQSSRFEARMVEKQDLPVDCCQFGVVDLEKGVEVCRVWQMEDARRISTLLNVGPSKDAKDQRITELEKKNASYVKLMQEIDVGLLEIADKFEDLRAGDVNLEIVNRLEELRPMERAVMADEADLFEDEATRDAALHEIYTLPKAKARIDELEGALRKILEPPVNCHDDVRALAFFAYGVARSVLLKGGRRG